MRFLVTGCDGFIGSHLCELLQQESHEVIGIDDGSTSVFDTPVNKYRHAISSYDYDDSPIDGIFHLAGRPGVELIDTLGLSVIEAPVSALTSVLRIADQYSSPVLFASSSEIYGVTTQVEPACENMPVGPFDMSFSRSDYAIAKLYCERLLYFSKVAHTNARLFNVIGTRQKADGGHAIPSFVKALKGNNPPSLFGSGEHYRTWQDVRVTVQIFLNSMLYMVKNKTSVGVLNVGAGSENYRSVRWMAETLSSIAGGPAPVSVPAPKTRHNDSRSRFPDIGKLHQLSLSPMRAYHLRETLEWIWNGS